MSLRSSFGGGLFAAKYLNPIPKEDIMQIRLTLSEGIYNALKDKALKLGKKPSMLARELMEQRMLELGMLSEILK